MAADAVAPRAPQHGGALLITLMLTVGLIGGGALLLRMQLLSTRGASLVTDQIAALSCAEAGLAAARPLLVANVPSWNGSLCNPVPPRGTGSCVVGSPAAEPSWFSGIAHDIDGDGVSDIALTLVDNDDEALSDLTTDTDSTVHLISTCTLRDARVQIAELVHYDAATTSLIRRLWIRTE